MEQSLDERRLMLENYNDYKRRYGRPVINTDPLAPFGQLVMVPGGEMAENPAYTTMPYFHDPDQFYDLNSDPNEQVNLIGDPNYADKIEELKQELRNYIKKLPGRFNVDGDIKFKVEPEILQ